MPNKPNQPAESKAGKSRGSKVTLIKQLKMIIILPTFHLQGTVLIFKHIEPKNICYVRKAQGKNKTTPKQLPHKKQKKTKAPTRKHPTVGSGIPHSQFCGMAFHPTTK